ncbi:alpha/beta fold hydrolase [Nocardia sp. CDC159]|uniref:Thioesterase TesA n=1 Tax=Nocardia pulmonis TaxID=2951408 RepID=A0A9X2E1J5_9NOCA|nr:MULTISPECIES: alpha/beta fold hydrolase [Nocardia]MCM6772322.1 alpha/beta fold hydrolase [Nocardia pulmonis]MCM6785020.1 alpha/beta fold hydrolase [Nocardia sp. CDC159]
MGAEITGTKWLRELRGVPGPRAVLVCFPPGGGSAVAYRALAGRIGGAVAVFAVQYPGRQDRLGEPMITDLAALGEEVARDLAVGQTPLALFGHSMGATVAFETARRLQTRGRDPIHLFVSGRIAPDAPYEGRLHEGSDAELIDELERLANDPASVAVLRSEPTLAEIVLPAVRGDYRAVETYAFQPGEPLRCNVSGLVGDEDPTVTPDRMREWQRHTTGEFDLTVFSGRHFYLDENPGAVADLVNARLA